MAIIAVRSCACHADSVLILARNACCTTVRQGGGGEGGGGREGGREGDIGQPRSSLLSCYFS